MTPTHTRRRGRLYRCYVSINVIKQGADACPVRRVPVGEIKAAVIDQVRALIRRGLPRRPTSEPLQERICRWLVGEPGAQDFHFCNSGRSPTAPIARSTTVRPAGRPADFRDAPELLGAIKMQVRRFDPHLRLASFRAGTAENQDFRRLR
jgi:hypothetical protein